MKKTASRTSATTESPDREDATAETGPETFLEIGTFDVVSGTIIVGDPCYERGDRRAKLLRNVERGTWRVTLVQREMETLGLCTIGLACAHSRLSKSDMSRHRGLSFEVDSGTAGVFDAALYGEDGLTPHVDCFPVLESEHGGLVLQHGAVSTTVFGDGVYEGSWSVSPGGRVVAVCIQLVWLNLLEDMAGESTKDGPRPWRTQRTPPSATSTGRRHS